MLSSFSSWPPSFYFFFTKIKQQATIKKEKNSKISVGEWRRSLPLLLKFLCNTTLATLQLKGDKDNIGKDEAQWKESEGRREEHTFKNG